MFWIACLFVVTIWDRSVEDFALICYTMSCQKSRMKLRRLILSLKLYLKLQLWVLNISSPVGRVSSLLTVKNSYVARSTRLNVGTRRTKLWRQRNGLRINRTLIKNTVRIATWKVLELRKRKNHCTYYKTIPCISPQAAIIWNKRDTLKRSHDNGGVDMEKHLSPQKIESRIR